MKTILITLTLSVALLAVGAAEESRLDAKSVAFLEALRKDEEAQRQKELAAEGEKDVAALRKDLAGPWTSVIIAMEFDCSCLAPSFHGFRLRRGAGAVTVERWCLDRGKIPVGVPRPLAQPEVERLLAETAMYFLAATRSVAPNEKAGPMPGDAAGQKEWVTRLITAGGSPEGGDTFSMDVRVTTPEGERHYNDLWGRDCPKDFSKWVAAFGTLP